MSETVNTPVAVNGRTVVAIRLKNSGLAVIDRLAERETVTRSEMIRRLLSEAVTARRVT